MRKALLLIGCLLAPSAARANGYPATYDFAGNPDGAQPRATLLAGAEGVLYGTTLTGGAAGLGTVFELAAPPTGSTKATETTIWSFTGTDGSFPTAGLVQDSAGNLYGTTFLDGGAYGGTVFELSPPAPGQTSWTETVLWHFGRGQDGKNPAGDLLLGPGGVLYGTTNWGGAGNNGTVFELRPPASGASAWTEDVVWSFTGGADGSQPVAGLVADATGAVYGTTKLGGPSASGTVFMLTPPVGASTGWTETTLWGFTGGADGAEPSGKLLSDSRGNLYGTATFGGAPGLSCAQSLFPYYGEPSSQSQYAAGAAYVPAGGNQCGTIFELSPPAGGSTAWTMTTIRQLAAADGANPVAGLAALPGGKLVGFATKYGPGQSGNGVYGNGVYGDAFALTPNAAKDAWTLSVLAGFETEHLGIYPRGAPVLGSGHVFGTMIGGGTGWVHVKVLGDGIVFEMTP